jgi:predicted MPP superfamily phosphohydrolase
LKAKHDQFQLIHISDLHISQEDDFDRSVVLDPLIGRTKEDLKKGFTPEIVVVTGDIAFSGKKEEYEMAKTFFDHLLECLGLSDDRLFIVPGNHDVDRKRYRPKDVPAYDNMRELNTELADYRLDLFKGMTDYFWFIETHYSHLQNISGWLVPFVTVHKAKCGKRIGLVGLNSAWMCRRSPDERDIAIGEYQIKSATQALETAGEVDLVINLFHHPLNWLWPEDRRICRAHMKNAVLLCGHLHAPDGGFFHDLDGQYYQFQAGGGYLGSDSPQASRFHYLTFDWGTNEIRVDFRKFDNAKRQWCVDAETGEDGAKRFPMIKGSKSILEPVVGTPEIPVAYLNWLSETCGYMDLDRLRERGEVVQVGLPEIFIPLYAHEPGKRLDENVIHREKDPVVDIEDLVGKSRDLLIEGHAGSGKTTLLKHVAYCLTSQSDERRQINGLDGFLPVLVFLKDLRSLFDNPLVKKDEVVTAQELLTHYFGRRENVFEFETLTKFVETERVVFLLDGLDELDREHREAVVNAFASLHNKYGGNKIVFSSRPHGLTGAAVDKFGKNHVKILPLNMPQVETFIEKWFRHVFSRSSAVGVKTARAMISDIKDHPATDRLIDNPLMLTAICILYHDGKELPGQRAELYKKFVNNLLYRRFDNPEKVHEFLITLAFRMHKIGAKGVDRVFAVEVLQQVHEKQAGQTDKEYRRRLEESFDDIESKCGLLRFEDGQYLFWHLTFQEFLAAVYIVDNHMDYAKAIESFWDDDRYKEVIELYIGYLSIENKKWANRIVDNIISVDEQAPFHKWLLASRSLIDIHKERRDPVVLQNAKARLLAATSADIAPSIRVEAGEILGWLGDTRDLTEFVRVSEGTYQSDTGIAPLKAFGIGKYPVTNSWFEEFIDSGGYMDEKYWSPEGRKWFNHTRATKPRLWDERTWKCPNSPVVGVSWYEADAFTRWLTSTLDDGYLYRLPDEKEWEAAAVGLTGRKYPWGEQWNENLCNTSESKIGKTSPVGIFPNGATPEGICDMAGNVWEWTRTDYHSQRILDDFPFDERLQRFLEERKLEEYLSILEEQDRQLPVLRGGSWYYNQSYARCAYR